MGEPGTAVEERVPVEGFEAVEGPEACQAYIATKRYPRHEALAVLGCHESYLQPSPLSPEHTFYKTYHGPNPQSNHLYPRPHLKHPGGYGHSQFRGDIDLSDWIMHRAVAPC